MTPWRWVVRFQIEPKSWVQAGGHPKWTPERIHQEAIRAYGPLYTGRFIPSHMQEKPRFVRLKGTKYFARLYRMPDRKAYRLA
jgi:hypothetical protein